MDSVKNTMEFILSYTIALLICWKLHYNLQTYDFSYEKTEDLLKVSIKRVLRHILGKQCRIMFVNKTIGCVSKYCNYIYCFINGRLFP